MSAVKLGCPFCGASADECKVTPDDFQNDFNVTYAVQCKNCRCQTVWCSTIRQSIDKWDSRPVQSEEPKKSKATTNICGLDVPEEVFEAERTLNEFFVRNGMREIKPNQVPVLPSCRYCGTAGKPVCDKCEERLWDVVKILTANQGYHTSAEMFRISDRVLREFHAKLKEVAK